LHKPSFSLREYSLAAGTGGVVYAMLEVLWRGYTHWSMILAGALCAALLYRIRLTGAPLLFRCLMGTVCITLVEFAIGCTVNLWWKLDVWDYSSMPFHLWGQICPAYTALWFFLCPPAFWLCGRIQKLCILLDRLVSQENTAAAPNPQNPNSRTGQTTA